MLCQYEVSAHKEAVELLPKRSNRVLRSSKQGRDKVCGETLGDFNSSKREVKI